jgi:hypothetical protein
MNINLTQLQEKLCTLMCTDVKLRLQNDELLAVDTPFYFADGDPYQMYIKERPGGVLRLSDMGHTLMHLSYENNIDKFREGTRGKLFDQILAEHGVQEEQGEFYVDTPSENLSSSIFRLAQALTQVNDLTFLNRARTESRFYEELREQLYSIVNADHIVEDYFYEKMENAKDYPVDFFIEGKHAPLYLFGIPNKDKARLTTIILERLLREHADFDSLLIFSELETIPKKDLARLSNAGGEMIASLDATVDLSRKLLRKAKLS